MLFRRVLVSVGLLCLITLGLTSCLARRRLITRSGGNVSQRLLVVDRNSLLELISRRYSAVGDFSATVDMVPALGSAEKSHITEYKDVRAFILFRKPADIRLIGLFPVIRSKAFDMASTGADFKLSIPSRSLFIVGSNAVERPSQNKIENLRPEHFQDALLVKPIDLKVSKVLLENFTDEDNAFYILHEVHLNGGGQLQLTRTIWFSRLDLQLARQLVFDETGNILTDARYSQWRSYDNVSFPKHIEINRPRDEYAVVIDIVKMDINKGVPDDRFVLEQPEGSTLRNLGQPPAATQSGPVPLSRKKR